MFVVAASAGLFGFRPAEFAFREVRGGRGGRRGQSRKEQLRGTREREGTKKITIQRAFLAIIQSKESANVGFAAFEHLQS